MVLSSLGIVSIHQGMVWWHKSFFFLACGLVRLNCSCGIFMWFVAVYWVTPCGLQVHKAPWLPWLVLMGNRNTNPAAQPAMRSRLCIHGAIISILSLVCAF
jgi:hypothetical protein